MTLCRAVNPNMLVMHHEKSLSAHDGSVQDVWRKLAHYYHEKGVVLSGKNVLTVCS